MTNDSEFLRSLDRAQSRYDKLEAECEEVSEIRCRLCHQEFCPDQDDQDICEDC